jgi:L,D-peptidoglycan transpeptidase YkuD (ErfK/YbiS/YcfS/YnhG family)
MRVLARSPSATRGQLAWGGVTVACALGAGGRRARKREGDGATPIGRWRLCQVFYRADRMPRPRTSLPVRPLNRRDGWCDAVGDRNYNRWVRHPYPASAEKLWRSDSLYDLLVTLDHNTRPRLQGHGSAIFMHVAGTGYPATAGCVAVQRAHLLRLLAKARRGSVLVVAGSRCKKRPEQELRALRARTGKSCSRKAAGPVERRPRRNAGAP